MARYKSVGWGLLFIAAYVSILLVALVMTPPEQPRLACTDGKENADYSCGEGADYDDTLLPFVRLYDTPNNATFNAAAAETTENTVPYRGISLAGGEFEGEYAANGVFLPFDNDAELFIYKGMNTFRIPILWEYIADIDGTIRATPNYLERLDGVIANLTAKNATVILDLHNYMRYNPSNVALNTANTDPRGRDVIGVGRGAPTLGAVGLLWTNIVARYSSPRMIYGLMNEPHDVSFESIANYYSVAIDAIRRAERFYKLPPHLLLVSGNNWTGLHSWFGGDNNNSFTNANRLLFNDTENNTAIEVHQYFDDDASGTYYTNDCVSFDAFKPQFDRYWTRFVDWCRTKQVKAFLGEFGIPRTETCIREATYILEHIHALDSVFLGWTVWAAGNAWGRYELSLAPGGKVNSLLWQEEPYLSRLSPLIPAPPPLSSEAIAIYIQNDSNNWLRYAGGYLPFQFQGSADVAPHGGIGVLYSNNNNYTTPAGGLQIRYYTILTTMVLGVGITPPQPLSYAYSFSNAENLAFRVAPQCPIVANGPTANPGEARCFIVYNK